MRSFQIESRTRLTPIDAWEIVSTPEGVNAEFWPLLRMTFPRSIERLTTEWTPNQKLCRSWILLFGVLPVEYDDIAFAEVDEGRRFLERSEMLTQKLWQHEREIFEDESGSRIVDRVAHASRFAVLEATQSAIFEGVFRYRHLRIRQLYGCEAA